MKKQPTTKALKDYTKKELFDLINWAELEVLEYKKFIDKVKKELLKR